MIPRRKNAAAAGQENEQRNEYENECMHDGAKTKMD
jgi:hypothetical protein